VSVIISLIVAWFVWRWMRGPGGDWIEKLIYRCTGKKTAGTIK